MEATATLPGVRKTDGPGRVLTALRQKKQQQGMPNTSREMLPAGSTQLHILKDGQAMLKETLLCNTYCTDIY